MSKPKMSRLKELRLEKKLSLRQLERKTGISDGHLSQIENGKKPVGRFTAQLIANSLGVNWVHLWESIELPGKLRTK